MAVPSAGVLQKLEMAFAKAHTSGQHSDCKIICGPYEFNVHKIILISQSDYFEVALRQGTFKEGETGVIELKALPVHPEDQSDADADETCDDPSPVINQPLVG